MNKYWKKCRKCKQDCPLYEFTSYGQSLVNTATLAYASIDNPPSMPKPDGDYCSKCQDRRLMASARAFGREYGRKLEEAAIKAIRGY